jgi:hypothetical protein
MNHPSTQSLRDTTAGVDLFGVQNFVRENPLFSGYAQKIDIE